jgi:hypothetical protein
MQIVGNYLLTIQQSEDVPPYSIRIKHHDVMKYALNEGGADQS